MSRRPNTFVYEVELADGSVYTVHADQRDWAAMEAQNFPEGQYLTVARFIAYNAMRRENMTRRSWPQFNLEDCVSLSDVTSKADGDAVQDGEDEQRLDPGLSTTNVGAGYFSPLTADSRSTALGGF